MKAKDIQPGVVYGHNSSKAYGSSSPIMFLAPVDRDHLYQTTSSHSAEGTPAFAKSRSGAKPGRGSMYSSPTIGYPVVRGTHGVSADKLTTFTLADFEAATSAQAGDGCWFDVMTVLAHVLGPYEEICEAEDKARAARDEKQLAEEQAQGQAIARQDALIAALAGHGVTALPDERYRRPSCLRLDFHEADKLLALLASPDSSEKG